MQVVLDDWLIGYDIRHRNMNGRTPIKAFTDGIKKTDEKAKGEKPAKHTRRTPKQPLPDARCKHGTIG